MENDKGKYSILYYSLIAASIGTIVYSGYKAVTGFFEKEEIDLDKYKSKQKALASSGNINFEKILRDVKSNIKKNETELGEEITIKIIGLIKEYADYLYGTRNKVNIEERRRLLFQILGTKIDNTTDCQNSFKYGFKITKLNEGLIQKYESCCGKEYFDLYNFSLKTARKYVMKRTGVSKQLFVSSWDKISSHEFIYYKINYYSNIFSNLFKDETEIQNFEIDFIKQLFENYCSGIIRDVSILEKSLLGNLNLSNDQKDEEYANTLQFIKLKISDEMYLNFKIDDKMLKYLAITKYEIEKKDEKHKSLLEKVNGIDLISIGFS